MPPPIWKAWINGWQRLVPLAPGEKYPKLPKWQKFGMTPPILTASMDKKWEGYGLLAEHHPAVDIDVTDPNVAGWIRDMAFDTLGLTAVRTGNPPKCLLPYNTSEPFTKRSISIFREGMKKPWQVEILAKGQQYVLYQIHPDTNKPYEWEQGSPHTEKISDLPKITAQMVDEFLQAVAEKFDPAIWTVTFSRQSRTATEDEGPTDPDLLLAPHIDRVRELVDAIPNPKDARWDGMKDLAMAIKGSTGGSSEGLEILHSWAARWQSKDEQSPEIVAKLWQGDAKYSGWETLTKLAAGYGVNTAGIRKDFDVVEETAVVSVVENTEFTMKDMRTADGVARWMAAQKNDFNYVAHDKTKSAWFEHADGRWVGPAGSNRGLSYAYTAINPVLDRMHEWLSARPVPPNKDAEKEYRTVLGNLQSTKFADLVRSAMVRTQRWDFNPQEKFDDHERTAHLLNTPEGTYDFHTGEIRPYDPLDFITRMTMVPIKHDDSKMPIFLQMLKYVAKDDATIDYLQRYFGSTLSSEKLHKVMLVMHGQSDAGKSSIANTIASFILGAQSNNYAAIATKGVILRRPQAPDDDHPAGVHSIMFARLAVSPEAGEGMRWHEHTIKALTGGDAISTRPLYGHFISVPFRGRLVATANTQKLPQTDFIDSGMHRRMVMMEVTPVPPEVKNEDYRKIIETVEAPYILGWLVEGYKKNLLQSVSNPEFVPQSMKAEAKEMMEEGDPLRAFVDEMLTLPGIGDDYFTSTTDLYGSFEEFCLAREFEVGSVHNSRSMGKALREIEALRKLKTRTAAAAGYTVRLKTKKEIKDKAAMAGLID